MQPKKEQVRFPRFRRTPEAKATVQKAIYTRLTEAVLEESLRRRWTRGTFIQMLVKAKHGVGAGTVNDNLLKLFRWEYVNKLDIFKHVYSGFNDSDLSPIDLSPIFPPGLGRWTYPGKVESTN